MSTQLAARPTDDLGIDRAFVTMLARLPLIAAALVLAAWAGQQFSPLVPVVILCAAMILAAVIDGVAFKVPNWLTLSMILAGWGIGLCNTFGWTIGSGPIDPAYQSAFPASGGITASLLGTLVGFGLLFPVFFIGGMGQGDVKMQTGFGAWTAAIYGSNEGLWTIVIAVCAGYIVGGILGIAMMLIRGQLHRNLRNVREIVRDLRIMVTMGPQAAHSRAQERRPTWHRLPYGIPLCIGFVGTILYRHWLAS